MLRNKVILAFVVVWCAVCVSYVGVRAAMGVVFGGSDATSESAEKVRGAEAEVQVRQEPVASTAPEVQTESSARESHESSSATEVQTNPVTTVEVATPEPVADMAKTPDVPSLSEYLSGFTCGSCRHNCTLDNPRCFNGSRLAEAKAQEYQELYQ